MKLPDMIYGDGIRKKQMLAFGGYNHTRGASDGELWDMTNLSSREYPLMTCRPKRRTLRTLSKPNGIFARDKLGFVDGTDFFYDGAVRGTVADSKKTFAVIGKRVLIFPDKLCYNIGENSLTSLEATYTSTAGGACFRSGTIYGVEAKSNTLVCTGANFAATFRAGDAVTISGCKTHKENNKTAIIREIDGGVLRFSENCFTLNDGPTDYTEPDAVTVVRTVPDMDYLCVNENRVWGCRDSTIYASKLGDPFNWNVFDGLETDSYAAESGSAGDFTGMISFLGYPVAFKEHEICKVYGSVPSNFQIMASAKTGVQDGSGASLAVAGETLFYLSRSGPAAFSGGLPASLAAPFGGDVYQNGVGGGDGLRYYLSAQDGTGAWHLFVYDSGRGMWHREDHSRALGFAMTDNLHMLTDDGRIQLVGEVLDPPADSTEEQSVSWMAEFGDFTDKDPNKKGVSKLQLRVELEKGASMTVSILYDSAGEWETVAALNAELKRSYYLPVHPHRADHYRIRLTGTGVFRLYSLVRESYSGSELKSMTGRNG